MFDRALRRFFDPPLDGLAELLVRSGVRADAVTLAGFGVGLAAVPLLAIEAYDAALVAILVNRLLDGLDGAVARRTGATDFGAFLDIACDFAFYAAVPLGFALARPDANALAALFLVWSFVATGTTFLAYAWLRSRRGEPPEDEAKSFAYLGGLTEGGETILLFVLLCVFPGAFVPLALVFGLLCWATAVGRALEARRRFAPAD